MEELQMKFEKEDISLEDGLKKVLQGDTSFDEIIKNLDIDDETLSFYDITTEETIKELETFHI